MVDAEIKQWIIFLCYSKEDKQCAEWVYKQLHSRNISVWFESVEALLGDSISQRIGEGLRSSYFLLVLVSKNAIESRWVKEELALSISKQVDEGKTIVLPVTLDDTLPEKVSVFLGGKSSIHIPCEGTEENLAILIQHIKRQLENQGLSELASTIVEEPPTPTSYPYGLVGGIQPDRFIVPEDTVNRITKHLVEGLSVSLVGARMMGKTSLLNFLSSEFYRRYYQRIFLSSDIIYLQYRQLLNGELSNMRFVSMDIEEYVTEGVNELIIQLTILISQEIKVENKVDNYQDGIKLYNKNAREDIEQFFRYYQTKAKMVYESYLESEVNRKEREWLQKYWSLPLQTGTEAKNNEIALTSGGENEQIIEKMSNLGLVFRSFDLKQTPDVSGYPLENKFTIGFYEGFKRFFKDFKGKRI